MHNLSFDGLPSFAEKHLAYVLSKIVGSERFQVTQLKTEYVKDR